MTKTVTDFIMNRAESIWCEVHSPRYLNHLRSGVVKVENRWKKTSGRPVSMKLERKPDSIFVVMRPQTEGTQSFTSSRNPRLMVS